MHGKFLMEFNIHETAKFKRGGGAPVNANAIVQIRKIMQGPSMMKVVLHSYWSFRFLQKHDINLYTFGC